MRSWSRPVVHATWHDGAICVWSWENGRPGASPPLHAFYSGLYGIQGPSGRVATLRLELPARGTVEVPCLRWPLAAAVGSLVGRPASPSWSASLAWFHELTNVAAAAAGSG